MSAPSFSSFPPSFNSFPDQDPGPSKPRQSDSVGESRKKRKKDRDNKLNRDKHTSRSSRPASVDGLLQDERLKAEDDRKHWDGNQSRLAYYSDRNGDPLIIQYGGLHAGDIPNYHLAARGRKILGLGTAWSVLHRSGKGVEIGIGSRQKAALTDASTRSLLSAAPVRRILSSKNKYQYEEIDGFLRLPSGRERHNDRAYRSITESGHPQDSEFESDVSDEEEAGSSDVNSDTTSATSHQATVKALEERIANDPRDISTWLSLLTHSLSAIPRSSKNATKARSEIAVAILSRALSAHPLNNSSIPLRFRLLKAGEEIWHESKVRAEWEDALKIGGADIWMEWLEWRIRRSRDGIDGIIEDAKRTLAAFCGSSEDDELGKVRVIWRMAIVFQCAGFVERAIALYQAQSELTFRLPQTLHGRLLSEQLDNLETFWESEVPRCGEDGANGWSSWVSSGCPEVSSSSKSSCSFGDNSLSDPFRRWAWEESFADRSFRMPIRSSDDNGESDPYGTVLFSDIRPLLSSLTNQRAVNVFRLTWLALLGLHIPGYSVTPSAEVPENWDDRWCYSHLICSSYIASIFPSNAGLSRLVSDAHAGVLIGREREYASSFGPVKNWAYKTVEPLSNGIGKGPFWQREDICDIDEQFTRRIFQQLRRGSGDHEWDAYALAFDAAVNSKSAKKLSRKLLSDARDSLPHWALHARLDCIQGRVDDARKIYQTILVSSPPAVTRVGASNLWWDWVEMEWLAGQHDSAVQLILLSVGVQGTSGVNILRAKRGLEESTQKFTVSQWKEREAWIKLRALLEFLTSSAEAAMSVFDVSLALDDILKPGDAAHESLTTASLIMLYQYSVTLRNPIRTSLLREKVEKALEMYSNNTLILGIFLEGEKGQGIWGRVRGLLGDNIVGPKGKEKDIARRVVDVWIARWDRGRWEEEIERTRTGLTAGLENERTRGSFILWRIYLEFEIRVGQLQRAKSMLFRAIGECPLVKELYLLAFGPLRAVFTPKELNGLANTMVERGLRLRKGLDEAMQDLEENGGQDNDHGGDSEDELEHDAKELRRLMPY